MRLLDNGFIFFVLTIVVLSITACDEAKFQREHPQEARIAEEVIEGGEAVAETVVEGELHLPSGVLKPIFEHKVFMDGPD